MNSPLNIAKLAWTAIVVVWIGSSLVLKSLILSGRWGSVPSPNLVSITIGGHEYLTSKWIGLAYVVTSIGLVVVGVLFAANSSFRK